MKVDIQFHLAGLSLSDTVSLLAGMGVSPGVDFRSKLWVGFTTKIAEIGIASDGSYVLKRRTVWFANYFGHTGQPPLKRCSKRSPPARTG